MKKIIRNLIMAFLLILFSPFWIPALVGLTVMEGIRWFYDDNKESFWVFIKKDWAYMGRIR